MNSPFRRMILALSVLSLLAFPGCGSEENGPNQPPVAYLTTGPMEGTEIHYRITVSWTATDQDGAIDHYEYAVDPPSEFTET